MKLKRLLLASALALSFVVSTPSQAKADPISAAIVTFIGFTGTAATVATFVINSALYAAGSWAVGKAAQALGLVKSAVAERQASVTTLSLGETPRELIVGQACTGGTLIDAFNFGGKYGTDTVTRCIGLADHEVSAIVGYYVDDRYYPWVVGGVQPGFNGKLSIDFRNAAVAGWAPPLHVVQNGGWAFTDRLCSIAHVWVDTRVDDQVWSQGHPRFRFVINGLKAYDMRKDAALGYTGPNPHVWEDVSTHEFTRNAEVIRYNYQRGIYAAGKHGQTEHLLIGRGLTAEEAPPHRVIAAANLCDEIVDGEPRYTANGVVSAAQSFIDVEEMFAAAMAGVIVQRDGGVEVEPGQAKAAFLTITDADLAAGEPVSFTEFQPDTDGGRINTVVPRYVEPAQGYKDHGGPPRRNLADIQEDGGPREMTLPLMLVTSGGQADRCAEIARRRARLERRASIVLPPDYAEIEEGDWIAWKSDRYHGGGTVRYQVTSYSLDEKWRQHLSLEEIASSVYGVPDPVEDRAEPPPAPTPVDALQLTGATAEAITLAGETSTVPAIRFRWESDIVDTAMIALRAEVRRVGETEAAPTRFEDVAKGEMIVTNGVGADMALEARLVPIGDPSRPVVPTNWFTLSTSTIVAGDLSPESPVWTELELQGEAVGMITDRLVSAEALVAANAVAVADLEEVFGDTVSAAESALAAGDAANLATLKAGDASAAAAASNVSAGIASTKADEAGNSATAANVAKVAAEAARDLADTKATASATNAANAAASATAAGEKATASDASATQAATRAGEALTYRNQSSSSATEAGTAAANAVAASISAGVSASTARGAVAQTIPTAPGVAPQGFSFNQWANPNDPGPDWNLANLIVASPANFSVVNNALRISSDQIHIHATKITARPSGHKVRCSLSFRRVVDGGDASNNRVTLYAFGWNANLDTIATVEITNAFNPTVAQGVQTLTYDLSDIDIGPGCVWIRTMARIWTTDGATELLTVETLDVQSEAAAASSAAAAVAQAASAGASASSASISANLAATAANARQNLIPNSTALAGMQQWTPWSPYIVQGEPASPDGSRFIWYVPSAGPKDASARSEFLDYSPNQPTSVSAEIYSGGMISGANRVYIEFLDAGLNILDYLVAEAYGTTNAWVPVKNENKISPAGTAYIRAYMDTYAANWGPSGAVAAWRKIKVEMGPTATPWNDYATDRVVSAQLNITAAVAADAQTRLSTVRFDVSGGAGGDPFEIAARADASGSLAMLTATALRFRTIVGGIAHDVMKLIGDAVHIVGPLYIGPNKEIELNPISANPHISIKVGSGRIAMGKLPNDNLIYWFGPSQDVSAMRKNNATEWRDTTGKAYFGGSILAGTLSNTVQGTNSAVPASVTLGPFATNGGPIAVAWSYSFAREGRRWGDQTGNINGSTTALVRLYRTIAGSGETLVDSMTVSGDLNPYYDGEPVPGQPSGTVGQTFFTEYMGGSRTFTDNVGGTQARTYRVEVASRSLQSVGGQSSSADSLDQRYGAVSSE